MKGGGAEEMPGAETEDERGGYHHIHMRWCDAGQGGFEWLDLGCLHLF